MSIISAAVLFGSWVVSTFVGFAVGITYCEWGRKRGLEEILQALISEETGHVE
jgi:hypothetical protein